MQSKMSFPSSHQLKYYVAPKSRLKFATRFPVSSCWPSCLYMLTVVVAVSDASALCYVLPVLWITSCFPIISEAKATHTGYILE